MVRVGRDPHAGGDGDRVPGEDDVGDRGADLLGGDDGAGDVGVRQHDGELLAAVAAGEVAVPQHGPQRGADVGQYLITDGVTEAVVDVLEVVQVEHQQARRGQGAGRLGEDSLEGVGHRPLVGQAGE